MYHGLEFPRLRWGVIVNLSLWTQRIVAFEGLFERKSNIVVKHLDLSTTSNVYVKPGAMRSQLVPLLAAVAVCTKIIIDNDWTSTGFITFLLALDAGWDVLGLVGDTANTWALQSSLHALALLEIGNLSVPVHKGADYPLLNSPELFDAWQMVHGSLSFVRARWFPTQILGLTAVQQGVFAPYNATAEELGKDPTSGNPSRISKAAFVQGYPNTTISGNMAAAWMVEQVRKYPGEVTIYSGGALTNVALAIRLDSEFASLTRGLVIMGGYIDVTLLEAGSKHMADLNSDVSSQSQRTQYQANQPSR